MVQHPYGPGPNPDDDLAEELATYLEDNDLPEDLTLHDLLDMAADEAYCLERDREDQDDDEKEDNLCGGIC